MSLVRDQDPKVAGDVSEPEVRAQLDRILPSGTFKDSERLQRFLKCAVECALDGTTDRLKESVLGRVDRGAEFDPRRFASAEQWLQAALVLDRDPPETHYWLAHVYMSQRRFAAALEQAQRCQTIPQTRPGIRSAAWRPAV